MKHLLRLLKTDLIFGNDKASYRISKTSERSSIRIDGKFLGEKRYSSVFLQSGQFDDKELIDKYKQIHTQAGVEMNDVWVIVDDEAGDEECQIWESIRDYLGVQKRSA